MTAGIDPRHTGDRFSHARATYRTLLVHVQPDPVEQPRLTAAAALAAALDARLFGVAAEAAPQAPSDLLGLTPPDEYLRLRARIEAHHSDARAAFARSTDGLATTWLQLESPPATAIARASRGADLIVAGGSTRRDAHYANVWCDPGVLVLLSGRPVLVVPSSGGRLSAEAVVVAWKDAREARRALADALPFLRCAGEVVVLEVCGETEYGDAEARTYGVVEGLRQHNVAARAKCVIAPAERAAEEIKAAAAEVGADLIVAGGYGHSRLGEWIFGGVTNDLLADPERFLLLSH